MREIDWNLPVLTEDQCVLDPASGQPWCEDCGDWYVDCKHPGPTDTQPVEIEDGPNDPVWRTERPSPCR
jgi:hypothetical protein